MPTPYEASAPPREVPAGGRPPLARPVESRVIVGVCAGLAHHLGVRTRWVRVAFVVLCIPTGAGIIAYLFLWAMMPQSRGGVVRGQEATADPADVEATARRGRDVEPDPGDEAERFSTRVLLVGGVLLLGGVALIAQQAGVNVRLNVLLPLLVVAAGAVLAWSQLDDAERGRWLGGRPRTRGLSVARLTFGTLLAVVGLVILASQGRSITAFWDTLLATLAVLAGTLLIAAPWAVRLWNDLRREQAESARAIERADIAAHLHDSVLQTLALIQRQSHDSAAVAQLARRQERELRSWLYAAPKDSEESLTAALTEVVTEVEEVHGIPIEVITTGDRPMDPGGAALVRAVREALVNAARHAEPPVAVYAEVGPDGVEVFVRDHGEGFEVDDVPEDRLGVRESILGRMSRHGGTARVRRLEHGTEVSFRLPPLRRADQAVSPLTDVHPDLQSGSQPGPQPVTASPEGPS